MCSIFSIVGYVGNSGFSGSTDDFTSLIIDTADTLIAGIDSLTQSSNS